MLKKIVCQINFLVFFLLFIFTGPVLANIKHLCTGEINENSLNIIDNIKPELIEIKIDQYRNWQKNNIANLTSTSSDILLKFKKKFNATLYVHFNNKIKCKFSASVRQNGDHKDHIKFNNGNFLQSLDVDLKNGHINGITDFKLLIPETRGAECSNPTECFQDEIVISEIFREIGFLSPRTSLVNVKLNTLVSKMIFQEKAEKEMLEYHKRREGPILEGDERYKFTWYWENKHLFPSTIKKKEKFIIKNLPKLQLAKQTNVNWAIKSDMHLAISEQALTELNRIYLRFINQLQYDIYYNFTTFNLDNNLLAFNNKKQILEWDVFTAILFSTSRGHGLTPHNRKFYWNSIKGYFEPIYYDGNINIDGRYPHMNIPFTLFSSKSIKIATERINKIKIDELYNNIKLRGSSYSKKLLKKKIKNIIFNLNNINIRREDNKDKNYVIVDIPANFDFSKKYLNLSKKELKYYKNKDQHQAIVQKKNIPLTKEIWENYTNLYSEIIPEFNFVFNNPKKDFYLACQNKNQKLKCEEINFTNKKLKELLKGRLKNNNKIYQYIGKYTEFSKLKKIQKFKYKKIKIKKSFFFYDKNIHFNFDNNDTTFNIYQSKAGAKAFFDNGLIENMNINFYGYNGELKSNIPSYSMDERGLTGCLTFTNLKLKNVKIKSTSSTCEDSINFINVTGLVNKIDIKNSHSDGLDIDFSNIEIDHLIISSSGNDCVDLSYGKYKFNKLYLMNCGDKALSIGEKSFLQLNKIFAENTNIGIALKDSSKALMNNVNLKNLKTCVAAYNKKQEFSGGLLKIKNINCKNFNKKTDADAQSIIVIDNEL